MKPILKESINKGVLITNVLQIEFERSIDVQLLYSKYIFLILYLFDFSALCLHVRENKLCLFILNSL